MRAPFEGPDQIGRRQRVIDDQRHARLFGDARDTFQIADHPAGIGDAFAEDRPRLVRDLARLKLSASVASAQRTCQSYFVKAWPNWLTDPP